MANKDILGQVEKNYVSSQWSGTALRFFAPSCGQFFVSFVARPPCLRASVVHSRDPFPFADQGFGRTLRMTRT